MEMLRKRLRRWLREEGLMTVIVLVIFLPLLLLAVANAGHRGKRRPDLQPQQTGPAITSIGM